ncbi:MAG TPA: ASPIC/UnbV domain-containing protein, partial [Archangium sp.]|uniref:ASPIC/UnbV domain-containing protein n=1 Tax=Archangium sp. TaxID=1872627 RepID=UPI002EDAD36A
GERTSRDAVGTRVVVSYDEGGQRVEQVHELGLMGGLSASADPRLHFGLGRHAGPVTASIHWYGGEVQTVRLEADRYHVIHQPAVTAGIHGAE